MKSVAETGYNSFHPSACVPGLFRNKFHVLDCALKEDGEEVVALSWAKCLRKKSDTIYLAFRCGDRMVTVLKLKDDTVTDSLSIEVHPYLEDSG